MRILRSVAFDHDIPPRSSPTAFRNSAGMLIRPDSEMRPLTAAMSNFSSHHRRPHCRARLRRAALTDIKEFSLLKGYVRFGLRAQAAPAALVALAASAPIYC